MLIHGNRNLAPPAKSLTDVKAAYEAKHINLRNAVRRCRCRRLIIAWELQGRADGSSVEEDQSWPTTPNKGSQYGPMRFGTRRGDCWAVTKSTGRKRGAISV